MKSQNLHALIIGGGIAGPALALLLKKAGISAGVYKAHQRQEDVGGGFTIAPNGMNVLEEIGLADSVADTSAKGVGVQLSHQSGKVLARCAPGNVVVPPSPWCRMRSYVRSWDAIEDGMSRSGHFG
jgi:2-polyprenyl-6-methoxyphenol hydroxylase-like FAD-dependent oxidoreductase